jgi:hypothetical protein
MVYLSRNQPGPGGLGRLFRRLPARLFSVPRGQTQPQKKRPSKTVSPTRMSDSQKSPSTVWEARNVVRTIRGSKSRKILTGQPSSSVPFDSVWMKRKRKRARNRP